MDGWMDLLIRERAGELRAEAEERRLERGLKAARTKKRDGGVLRLLRGLTRGIAGLAPRTAAISASTGSGCADDPGVTR